MTKPSATNFGMPTKRNEGTAIFALTRGGARLAARLQAQLPASTCYCNERYVLAGMAPMRKLGEVFPEVWNRFGSIVCIMGCGIVVRTVAPLIGSKTADPAVVVVDEQGRFAISLLSGHLGGANRLAREVARITGGQAVITTASDIRGKPAVDLIAREAGLVVENPAILSRIAAAVIDDEPVWIYDPQQRFTRRLPPGRWFDPVGSEAEAAGRGGPGIWVCDRVGPEGPECLKLRPLSLVVGIGCNRGAGSGEIAALVREILAEYGLSAASIRNFASIDLKRDEHGLIEAAAHFDRPIEFFSSEELRGVEVPNPSQTVARHVGVESVCEASALKSAGAATLKAPKRKSANCTAALAAVSFSS